VERYIAAHPDQIERIGGFGDDAIRLENMLDWALKLKPDQPVEAING
jgi:hypothetical protein